MPILTGDWKQDFLCFDGRINRKVFLFRNLILYGISIVVHLLMWLIFSSAASWIVSVAFAAPGFSLGIRRLHDLDKTGWFSLIYFIPVVNVIFELYLLFCKGTEGMNRYGSDPLENID